MKKLIFWAVIFVLILIILVIVLKFQVLQRTTYDTSRWKTFNNTEYGYSIKYPPDWHVSFLSTGKIPLTKYVVIDRSEHMIESDQKTLFPPGIYISILSPNNILKECGQDNYSHIRHVQIGGKQIEGCLLESPSSPGFPGVKILHIDIPGTKYIYAINFREEYLDIGNAMLNTFSYK